MNDEYNYPTQTFRFAVTFEYEVTAYNAKQAYEMIDNLNITSEIRGSGFIPLGRRSPKQMREIMKRITESLRNVLIITQTQRRYAQLEQN